MMLVRLLPVLLSALLLAAHFSRHEMLLLAILSMAFPLILFVRRSWVPPLVRSVLVLGFLEWVRTLVTIARQRQAAGDDWIRMAVILGMVAAVTLVSALVFEFRAVREHYRR
jgi:hypothetical protein